MIFGDIVRLLVMGMLLGGKQNGGTPSVPSGPFPSNKPNDLPPWPTGWCPDLPLPPEVIARGWQLVPTLWAKGEGTRTVEMTGGRWITYVATMVDGQKAIAAYRTTDCESVGPQVMPPGVMQEQQADAAAQALLATAIALNEMLRVRGYKKADMVHYREFQQKAGLVADGYPGAVTMLKLETVLKNGGQSLAPVKIYPWKATGAYDGVNAPTTAEWEGIQVPATSPISPSAAARPPTPSSVMRPVARAPTSHTPTAAPTAPPVTLPPPSLPLPPIPPPIVPVSMPSSMPSIWTVTSNTDVQHALNLTGYGPLVEDGIVGQQTKGATLAYQLEHPPLAKDGIPGPQTKAALTASVARGEHRSAAPGPQIVPAATGPVITTNVQVQHALNLLSYKGKDGKPLTEDGSIGPNSKYAILAFQKEHPPLVQDSIAGPQTKAALSAALAQLSQAA
jgi:peptidoglycan hydrolase-like protein with peptidoglycan-binding domain